MTEGPKVKAIWKRMPELEDRISVGINQNPIFTLKRNYDIYRIKVAIYKSDV